MICNLCVQKRNEINKATAIQEYLKAGRRLLRKTTGVEIATDNVLEYTAKVGQIIVILEIEIQQQVFYTSLNL